MITARKQALRYICGLGIILAGLISAGCEGQFDKSGMTVKYYYTQTEDGISLALRRYRPERLTVEKNPVILCHGFSYNLLFWDLEDEVSLPRYLARQGYDVWSLSLRGACPSSQPLASALRKLGHFHLEPEIIKTLQKRLADVKMSDWSVDDHIQQDVPAAIQFVRDKTKHQRVHWVGHSMGAMIMLGYLGQAAPEQAQQIKSLTALGAPMVVFHPLSDPFNFLLEQEQTLKVGSKLVGSSAPATFGAIFGDLGTPMDKLFYNSDNMHDSTIRSMFQKAEEEIAPSQFKQLMNMVRTERFISLDGKKDYTSMLNKINTPAYLLVGTVDNMATPGAVCFLYRQLNSQNKLYRMFGRVNAHRKDYGHNDIVIGKYAREEVYPTIAAWLDEFPSKTMENEFPLQPRKIDESKK
jgi:pimeloyl-ACP methyl ester carboxylesterase